MSKKYFLKTIMFITMFMLISMSAYFCSEEETTSANTTTTTTASITNVTQVTATGFSKSVLLVMNLNGATDANATEAIGTFPTFTPDSLLAGSSTKAFPRDNLKRIPDLPMSAYKNIGNAPIATPNRAPSKIITTSSYQYTFWGMGATATDQDFMFQFDATQVFAGTNVMVYVEMNILGTTSPIFTGTDWTNLGSYLDGTVYPTVFAAFGTHSDVDGNGKVVFVYYDMLQANDSTGGFFMNADLTAGTQTNEMEVLHINIAWGGGMTGSNGVTPESTFLKGTLAHELEHLINYSQRQLVASPALPAMDSWIDEGMAEGSMRIVLGSNVDRIDTFNIDSSNNIKNGLGVTTWLQLVDNYALSYMALQYCKLQSTSADAIFGKFITYQYGDYRAIGDIMHAENAEFDGFEDVMVGFRLANLLNQPTGVMGYKGDTEIKNLTIKTPSEVPTAADAKVMPSGAFYLESDATTIKNFTPSGNGEHVFFVKIN